MVTKNKLFHAGRDDRRLIGQRYAGLTPYLPPISRLPHPYERVGDAERWVWQKGNDQRNY